MPKFTEEWRTYKGTQAGQIVTALDILLEAGTLGEDEQQDAKLIKAKLKGAIARGEVYTSVPFSGKQLDLINQVEGALWR